MDLAIEWLPTNSSIRIQIMLYSGSGGGDGGAENRRRSGTDVHLRVCVYALMLWRR